ncbi:MAG: hypothetical protein IPM45_18040 [Acidimicrobiales bacterium]|nr:hypothetical protein [Acidimicrobiales bacterium]
MPSDSDRILAAGVPIALAGGETGHCRFSLRGLKLLEDTWGSLAAAAVVLDGLQAAARSGWDKGGVGDLAVFLAAALGTTPDDALDLVDGQVNDCVRVLVAAWVEAFPAPAGKAGGEATKSRPSRSTGRRSTTSPP